jgi:hypothetical protein
LIRFLFLDSRPEILDERVTCSWALDWRCCGHQVALAIDIRFAHLLIGSCSGGVMIFVVRESRGTLSSLSIGDF